MKKTFKLDIEGKNRVRVLEAIKHEVRKYVKRERRRELPQGVDFWDFDCRFGLSAETAVPIHFGSLIEQVDSAAKEGAAALYVEILPKHGHRKAKPTEAASDESPRP